MSQAAADASVVIQQMLAAAREIVAANGGISPERIKSAVEVSQQALIASRSLAYGASVSPGALAALADAVIDWAQCVRWSSKTLSPAVKERADAWLADIAARLKACEPKETQRQLF